MSSLASMLLVGGLGPILFGIAILLGERLIAASDDSARTGLSHTMLSVVGWVLIAIGGLACFVSFLSPMGFVLWVAVLIVLAEALVRRRVAQQYALLWLLTTAAERFIPLIPVVSAFARERGGLFGLRAHRLTGLLGAGVPLAESLLRVPGLVPAEALPMIRIGEEAGALAPALRRAASARDSRRHIWLSLAGRLVYLCGVLWFGLGIVLFVMVKIVPEFGKIFSEFEADLPPLTQGVVTGSWLLLEYGWVLLPVFVALALLLVYAVMCYIGWVRWSLPGTHWLTGRLDTAVILDALALAAERQRPLPEALASLARWYPNGGIRRRLARALRDVDAGRDWCESLLARGLIRRADLAVLQAAQRAGNLPWALREMADSNRRRTAYRLQALVQILFPPVILLLGLVVALFVVGLFVPLVALIERLT